MFEKYRIARAGTKPSDDISPFIQREKIETTAEREGLIEAVGPWRYSRGYWVRQEYIDKFHITDIRAYCKHGEITYAKIYVGP